MSSQDNHYNQKMESLILKKIMIKMVRMMPMEHKSLAARRCSLKVKKKEQTSKIKNQSMTRMQISLIALLIRRRSQYREEVEEVIEEAGIEAATEEEVLIEITTEEEVLIEIITEEEVMIEIIIEEVEAEEEAIIMAAEKILMVRVTTSSERTTTMINKEVVMKIANDTVISSRTPMIQISIKLKKMHYSIRKIKA
mgnify:CR=1 FL=1